MNAKETAVDVRLNAAEPKVGDRVRIIGSRRDWRTGLTGTLVKIDNTAPRYLVELDYPYVAAGTLRQKPWCLEVEVIEAEQPQPAPGKSTRIHVLDEAKKAVAGREEQYGGPENSFERIAALWTAYYGARAFSATDVAIMLALMKVARIATNIKHTDSWVDLAGYAACGAEVAGA